MSIYGDSLPENETTSRKIRVKKWRKAHFDFLTTTPEGRTHPGLSFIFPKPMWVEFSVHLQLDETHSSPPKELLWGDSNTRSCLMCRVIETHAWWDVATSKGCLWWLHIMEDTEFQPYFEGWRGCGEPKQVHVGVFVPPTLPPWQILVSVGVTLSINPSMLLFLKILCLDEFPSCALPFNSINKP